MVGDKSSAVSMMKVSFTLCSPISLLPSVYIDPSACEINFPSIVIQVRGIQLSLLICGCSSGHFPFSDDSSMNSFFYANQVPSLTVDYDVPYIVLQFFRPLCDVYILHA